MTIAFFVLLWLFINLMILFIMQFVEEKYSPLELFVEIIAIIISPILWISFWTVVNRIRKAHRKRKKRKKANRGVEMLRKVLKMTILTMIAGAFLLACSGCDTATPIPLCYM